MGGVLHDSRRGGRRRLGDVSRKSIVEVWRSYMSGVEAVGETQEPEGQASHDPHAGVLFDVVFCCYAWA